jgi:hypothetical protein
MLRANAAGGPVCLTVTLMDGYVLARSGYHHSVNYRSAMCFGTPRLVEDLAEKTAALKGFMDRLFPGRWEGLRPPTELEMKATSVLAMAIDEASAKVRTGPPGGDPGDETWPIWAGVLPVRTAVTPSTAPWSGSLSLPNTLPVALKPAWLLPSSRAVPESFTATGAAGAISTLRYHPEEDVFRSPNGELARIDDIDAEPQSILGAWTGHEWKFEEETGLGKTKENFALGRMAGGRFGLVVYRMQELSSEGTRLLDRSVVIRFPLQTPAPVKVTPRKKP